MVDGGGSLGQICELGQLGRADREGRLLAEQLFESTRRSLRTALPSKQLVAYLDMGEDCSVCNPTASVLCGVSFFAGELTMLYLDNEKLSRYTRSGRRRALCIAAPTKVQALILSSC